MIIVCDFIIKLIDEKLSNKECFKYVGKYAIIFATAILLYYVIWKLLMKFQGVTPTDYQGISDAGKFNISVATFVEIIYSFATFFVKEGMEILTVN